MRGGTGVEALGLDTTVNLEIFIGDLLYVSVTLGHVFKCFIAPILTCDYIKIR